MIGGSRADWATSTMEAIQADHKHALNGGPFGSKLVSKMYVESGVPVIRGVNLPLHERFSFDGLVFVTEEKAKELKPNTAKPGDVIFTQRGTLGQVAIIPDSSPFRLFVISQSQMKLTVNRELADPHFIYYLFRSPEVVERISSLASSSGVPHINLDTLRKFTIDLPPLTTQQRIATILSAYDDLIENNTRRIAILEEMARRLYEEWFVHFRFPGHEEVEFEGGKPRNWETGVLKDVVVLQRGFDLPTKARTPGPYPVFAASGKHGTHEEAKVKRPSVVTGRSGSLGTVVYVDEDFWPLNTTLWGKEFPLGSPIYAFYVLSAIDLAGFNSGAAVPTLNRNDVHDLPMALPPQELLSSFEQAVKPIFQQGRLLHRRNTNLRAQRDLLLPKLVSGEIDLSFAEASLEAAE